MISSRKLLFPIIVILSTSLASASDDVTLFDSNGRAVAYIALDDEMTIYLWGGKPVAYLDSDSRGGFHVYGFNGNHLGWFIGGVIRDHRGDAACAIKEMFQSTQPEPFKSFKEFKPFKSFKEFAPFRPAFSSTFSNTTCQFLLASGGL